MLSTFGPDFTYDTKVVAPAAPAEWLTAVWTGLSDAVHAPDACGGVVSVFSIALNRKSIANAAAT